MSPVPLAARLIKCRVICPWQARAIFIFHQGALSRLNLNTVSDSK